MIEREPKPGDLYVKDGEVWRVVWYSENPTVGLKNLDTGVETSGTVNSLMMEDYNKLEQKN